MTTTRPRGFSLIELLVAMAVITILAALALPQIVGVRRSARELRCIRNVQGIGQLVSTYTIDARDQFPCWVKEQPQGPFNPTQVPSTPYAMQVYTGLSKQGWLDYAGLDRDNPMWHCPGNERIRVGRVRHALDYALSASLFVRPSYFDPTGPIQLWQGTNGARLQTISAASWPSRKVAVFERQVWHAWRGAWGEGVNVSGLLYYHADGPGSVWFLDGHAGVKRADSALEWVDRTPHWNPMPFGTTAYGLHGRDE